MIISGDVITLEEINKLIDELKLSWRDGDKSAFNETAKIIDEIREIVASTLKGNPRQAKTLFGTHLLLNASWRKFIMVMK